MSGVCITASADMASVSGSKKRHFLTLKYKVAVQKMSEKDSGMNHRTLAEKFECEKTQIAQILKKKRAYFVTTSV